MPFNGAGVFNRLYSWVQDAINGIKIRADRMDAEDNGFATGLTDCVTRDGQSPALADLPMGGFKHTNVAAASAANEYLVYGQAGGSLSDLSIAGAALGGNKLAVTGNGVLSGSLVATGFHSHGGFSDDSGSGIVITGFGQTMSLSTNSLVSTATPIQVIANNSGGVILNNGATSWAAVSERIRKKNLEDIEDAYSIIMAHAAQLGHYAEDEDDQEKRAFLFAEDAEKHWRPAFHDIPAFIADKDYYSSPVLDAEGEIVEEPKLIHAKGDIIRPAGKYISLTEYIPLLVAAFQQQYAINQDLDQRLIALERKN